MNNLFKTTIYLFVISGLLLPSLSIAQTQHQHTHTAAAPRQEKKPPKIFFTTPKAIAYQLKRLDNERLLLVERDVNNKKHAPVFSAILSRPGISPKYREEALAALSKINETDSVSVLLDILQNSKTESRQDKQTARELGKLLVAQPAEKLAAQATRLAESTTSDNPIFSSIAFAGMIVAEKSDDAWKVAQDNDASAINFLNSISLVPSVEQRNKLGERVFTLMQKDGGVKIAALKALRKIKTQPDTSFAVAAAHVGLDDYRDAAVKTMLTIPTKHWNKEICEATVKFIALHAEATKPADRTSDAFIDVMQLADKMLAKLPPEQSKAYRKRFSAVSVRVVKIGTVEEEMRYDVPYFAVQAGTDVQVVLDNHDLMPHNIIFTKPGDLKLIAELGLAAGPKNGFQGKPYVPEHESVLFASDMVPAESVARLTFTAPTEPGEYPYVCTYPQHWSRMYGVMVVVDDLDAFQRNPVEPENPIGSDRSFIADWLKEFDGLSKELEAGVRGRTMKIGKRIYEEATCAQCHKLAGEGGAVGPELDELFARWKGDRNAILREILDPSHLIDEKYRMYKILTIDGLQITGIIQNKDDEQIQLLENPESKQLTTVLIDDIEEQEKTSISMMPKALMNNFSKDELFELFAYLENSQKKE